MPARQCDASLGTNSSRPLQHFLSHLWRQFIDRPAQDSNGQDGFATHRVDVAYRIGRSDTAKIKCVIYYRHEKVRGRDKCRAISQIEDRCIIPFIIAYKQPGIGWSDKGTVKDPVQDGRADLAAAACTM